MKQEIYIGARVQVINQNMKGDDFVEGYAIVKGYDPAPIYGRYYCSVEFENEPDNRYYRWISKDVLEA